MSFRFREMERCRVQLQPQSYHGITGAVVFPARGAAILSDSSTVSPRYKIKFRQFVNLVMEIYFIDSPHPRRLPDIRGSTDP